ncbi:MAG: diadenylate cyclase CdaA [Clostridia bacterium]|nr:diadenylate cyclase CdaA [Clostridia bacterium]
MAVLIYQLFLITRRTRSMQVFKGLMILIFASYLSGILGLTSINYLLQGVLSNGIIVILILFQPEVKRTLEYLGRTANLNRSGEQNESEKTIDAITQCLQRLSRRRVGALVVFEQKTGLQEFVDTGIRLDAEISAGLLENIFEPNTPLHDGAVIIRGDRIEAAACILHVSDNNAISHDLGTRHRAALGVSENSDAMVLIVSEETGIISMAQNGKLTRHLDADAVRKVLGRIYNQTHSRFWHLTHRQPAADKNEGKKGGEQRD